MLIDSNSSSEPTQRWTEYKTYSEQIAEYYRDSQFNNYSHRITNCADFLEFQCIEQNTQLLSAWFCRVRHCAICQWRRSLQWKARAFQMIPQATKDFPKDRWLFLTLTVKNCPVEELREKISWMHTAFNRLTRLKAWCVRGWIKSTEITKSRDGLAHPHFHCLLMVPASYFSGSKYLSQAKWVQLWQRSLQVEYSPVVDIRAIKRIDEPVTLIPEVLKYQTKVTDFVADPKWLLELTKQIHGTRSISSGGILKNYLRQVEKMTEESREGDDNTATPILQFCWNPQSGSYKRLY